MEEKKIKTKLPSTIVCGIFINAALTILVILLPIDLQALSKSLTESTGMNSPQNGSAIIAILVTIIMMKMISLSSLIILAHFILAPFLISNICTSPVKAIKIVNIVLLNLLGMIFVLAILRLIFLI